MDETAGPIPPHIVRAVHRLVEANRPQCLWFMKEDYFPYSPEEIDRTLTEIELHGDRQAWTEARNLRTWLSQNTSVRS